MVVAARPRLTRKSCRLRRFPNVATSAFDPKRKLTKTIGVRQCTFHEGDGAEYSTTTFTNEQGISPFGDQGMRHWVESMKYNAIFTSIFIASTVGGSFYFSPSLLHAQSEAAPAWEDEAFTKFRSIDCPTDAPDLVVHRSSGAAQRGAADILVRGSNLYTLYGTWTLNGTTLEVHGGGFEFAGTWAGNRLSAQVTGPNVNTSCHYRVSGTSG